MTLAERMIAAARRYMLPSLLMTASVVLAIWFASATPFSRILNEKAFRVFEPVVAVVQGPVAAIEEKIAVLGLWKNQYDDMETLRAENQRLKEWYQMAQMMKAENEALKRLLNVEHEAEHKFITARIVMDAQTPYAHTVLVNAGEGGGVLKGQGVVVEEGLIGRVLETGKDSARILLLRDMNSRIPVMVEDSKDKAILAGNNELLPVLEHLSPYNTVKPGQRVITSGHGGVLPYGIAVGETVLGEDGEMAVKLYADPDRASFVQVIDYGIKSGVAGGTYALTDVPSFQ